MTEEDFHKLENVAVEIDGTPGQILFKQGDTSDAFYVIKSGAVRIVKDCKADGSGGREISVLKDGDFFGELGVLEDSPRMAWAIISAESVLVQVKRADFENLMTLNPRIATKIMVTISRRYKQEQVRTEQERPAQAAQEREPGKVIVVNSMTGGSGVTTLVTNLGTEISRESQKRVILVDGSVQFGDLPIFVDEVPNLTLWQLSEEPEITMELLKKGYINKTKFGVDLVAAPKRPEHAEKVKDELLRNLLTTLRTEYDWIVVDSVSVMQDLTVTLLEMSDMIVYVMQADIPSLKNAGLWVDLIKALEFDPDKIRLIINKYPARPSIDSKAIEDKLKIKAIAVLPFRLDVPTDCINRGVPLCIDKPSDPIAVKIAQVAQAIVHPEGHEKKEESHGGWLGALGKRFGL